MIILCIRHKVAEKRPILNQLIVKTPAYIGTW